MAGWRGGEEWVRVCVWRVCVWGGRGRGGGKRVLMEACSVMEVTYLHEHEHLSLYMLMYAPARLAQAGVAAR